MRGRRSYSRGRRSHSRGRRRGRAGSRGRSMTGRRVGIRL